MGIGIVLLFWLCLGVAAAAIGAVILRGITAALTRGMEGRERVIRLAKRLPTAGLLWWAGVFVFQATINGVVFHRDPGLGDAWQTPLPNGYMLTMIDVTERGWVSRKTEGEMGPPISQLQIADRYILGRYEDTTLPRSYFLLDTATDKWQAFADLEALRTVAKPLRIQPALEPIDDVYSRYRTGWFDYFTLLLYLGYPIGALIFWVRRVRGIRSTAILAAA